MIVKFHTFWTYAIDKRGDVRREFPRDWCGEVDLEIAAAAVVDQAAFPCVGMTAQLEAACEALKVARAAEHADRTKRMAFIASVRSEAKAIVTAKDDDIIRAMPADPPEIPRDSRPITPPRAPRKPRT